MSQQPLIKTRIDPWHHPALQSRLALMRLSAAAAAAPAIVAANAANGIATAAAPQDPQPSAVPYAASAAEPPGTVISEANEHGRSSPSGLEVMRIDAALAVLAAAPPGAEAVALQALDSALRPDGLDVLLRCAQQALQQFAVRFRSLAGCLLDVLVMPPIDVDSCR